MTIEIFYDEVKVTWQESENFFFTACCRYCHSVSVVEAKRYRGLEIVKFYSIGPRCQKYAVSQLCLACPEFWSKGKKSFFFASSLQKRTSRARTSITVVWMVRGRFLISSLGANFDPQGWSWSPGVNMTPRGEVGPQGLNWPPGVTLASRGELWSLDVYVGVP
jgi:hypothetical protein